MNFITKGLVGINVACITLYRGVQLADGKWRLDIFYNNNKKEMWGFDTEEELNATINQIISPNALRILQP